MPKITYRKIAELAGVSLAAVSFAIQNKPGVSDKTRERILKIANQHGYFDDTMPLQSIIKRPVRVASLFRTAAPSEDQLFYRELNSYLLSACEQFGYWLVPTSLVGDPELAQLPRCIQDNEVDGVLIFGDLPAKTYEQLTQLGTPFVVLDSCRVADHSAVLVDYAQAAYTATRHLIDLGHTDIAFISNASSHDFNALTLEGFQQAMGQSNLHILPNRIQINRGDIDSIDQCLDRALAGETPPTGIFCTVDLYSFKILQRLRLLGLKVPEDISLVSMDDTQVAPLVTPPLTTVHIQRDRLVREGLRILVNLLDCQTGQQITLRNQELVVRNTSAPPRK